MGCRKTTLISFAIGSAFFGLWLEFRFLRFDLMKSAGKPWSSLPKVAENFDWDGGRPLNIVFLTLGSRGDHQPNVALALELARRGHNCTVLGLPEFRSIIEGHPTLHYRPLKDDYLWELGSQMGKEDKPINMIPHMLSYIDNASPQLLPQYLEASANADVLFGLMVPMSMLLQLSIAQALQKPLVYMIHDPIVPTSRNIFDAFGSGKVVDKGRRANVFLHRMTPIIMGAAATFSRNSTLRKIRSDLGLITPLFLPILSAETLADFPIFYTIDPYLWPPPDDHPPHWVTTGYFETIDTILPSDETMNVQEWIFERKQLQRPLLYFGQGSSFLHDATVYTDILLDALDRLEMDGIALYKTVDDRKPPPELYVLQEVDMNRILPQCDVIVHHGGAGTSSQVIRAGKPSVCMPALSFQQVWCVRLEELGAGTRLDGKSMVAAWETNRTNLLVESIRRVMTPQVIRAAQNVKDNSKAPSGGVTLAANKLLELLHDLRHRKTAIDPTSTASEL
jgi:sterol 3beta-glucosyltransferase